MRTYYTILCFLVPVCLLTGQKQNYIWYFGDHAGLDFNSSPPTPITGRLFSVNGSASISDPNGDLLFYTNGREVWDRHHNVMPHGTGLVGGFASAQPALIVPFPNSKSQYYLFTTEDKSTDGGMSYSIVDMRLNGGFGDIIASTKNTLVANQTADKVTAILHPNGLEIWIVTHKFNSDEFLSYLITSSGLDTFPIISPVGSFLSFDEGHGAPIKGSNNGSNLILASTNSRIIEMFDFDSGTGHISNVYNIQNLLNKQDDVYGFEFSPNDSILYICTFEEGSFVTHLYQLDLHSQLITDLNIPFESTPGGLQLGPDNKIYCNCKGAPHNALSIVHNPNKLGISCLFEYNALLLAPGTLSLAGFPAPSPYSFFLDSSSIPSLGKDTNVCTGSSLVLNPHFPTNCDSTSFLWSDGSTGTEITVDKSGEFWVEINSSCGSFKDTIQVDFTSCVPILYYDLEVCKANMIDGSNMDYSEFTPAYPNQICGEVKAGNVFRSSLAENKHSCTPGVGNSVAMCISSLNSCSYSPGHQGSLIFEVMIIPDPDTTIWIKGLEFYEKGPTTYSWINGPSGLNNYPLYYGIRILKNSTEIYHKENIPTSVTWSLQRFNFLDDTLFRVEENTTFRIELLPYCPVGNGADVSAWDIDEIKIFGGCASVEGFKPVIKGEVKTQENQAISGAEMHLSQDPSFSVVDKILTEETGIYLFDQLETGRSYFVKGNKNDDVLNGVSTLDLIYIQKHLLGITPFTTLYQYIAADVNHSGYVSVIDLLDLRKLLLGIYSEFPNNTSWRFGSWPQEMNGTQISHFGEVSSIEYLDKDTQIVDFVGIKTGDLNGDVRLQGQSSAIEIRNRNQLEFLIDDQEMIAGIPFILRIKSGEESLLAGFQFALDLHGMEFISLNSSTIPISQENYSVKDGKIRISWSSIEVTHISPGDILFSIELKSSSGGLLSQRISIADQLLKPEVYTKNLEVVGMHLIIKNTGNELSERNIFYVDPNPAKSTINLHFYLKDEGLVEFHCFDFTGRLLSAMVKNYSKGEQMEEIKVDGFPSGIIFCQILHNGITSVKMLIKTE